MSPLCRTPGVKRGRESARSHGLWWPSVTDKDPQKRRNAKNLGGKRVTGRRRALFALSPKPRDLPWLALRLRSRSVPDTFRCTCSALDFFGWSSLCPVAFSSRQCGIHALYFARVLPAFGTLPAPYCVDLANVSYCSVLTNWEAGLSMSFSQSSTGSAIGLGTYNILNNSQSLSSTPRATPPPPKGSQAASFGMSNGVPRGSFGGYDGANEYRSNMSYQDDDKPQIYRVRPPMSSISLWVVVLTVPN